MADNANFIHRTLKAFGETRLGSWVFARILHRLDLPLISLTRGRYSVTNILAGFPIETLITIGARSGRPRSVPLVVLSDGAKRILIASNFGQAHNPGWYYNLLANPKAKLFYKGNYISYKAREVKNQEYEKYWQQAVAIYHGYANYKQRASHRHIPIIVLEPNKNN